MEVKEFWHDVVTKKSWEFLLKFSKKHKFILIGGWAAYLWTKTHKSKDIDIIVDYETLYSLKNEFNIIKNERLKKYEIKEGEFDIDIYLPYYSKLTVPIEIIKEYSVVVQSIKVPTPEILILLKQGAELERRGTPKGKKDVIDILTILIHTDFSLSIYKKIVKKLNLNKFTKELFNTIKGFNIKELFYIGINANEYAKWKKNFLKELVINN